jgi:hypothetical protein
LTELTLGCLKGSINLASRNPVAFSVKLEVMNERLHRTLHLGAARGHDLRINEVRRALPIRCAQERELNGDLRQVDAEIGIAITRMLLNAASRR